MDLHQPEAQARDGKQVTLACASDWCFAFCVKNPGHWIIRIIKIALPLQGYFWYLPGRLSGNRAILALLKVQLA
jgi:hypothetical protein